MAKDRALLNLAGGITIYAVLTLSSARGPHVVSETGHRGAGPCARLEVSRDGRLQFTVIDRSNVAASAGVPVEPLLGGPLLICGILAPLGEDTYELQLCVNDLVTPAATTRAKLSLAIDLLAQIAIGAGHHIDTR